MRLVLAKVETTAAERTVARTMQAHFTGADDHLRPEEPALEEIAEAVAY
jgi:hypothetical protein